MNALGSALTLPNGQRIKNRLAKAAMSETLAPGSGRVPPSIARLYQRFARGGAGLIITGNVMIDRRAIGEPGNVVIEDDRDLESLSAWASARGESGCLLYMQLNHPGRQAPKYFNDESVAPSAIALANPNFSTPRPLQSDEIETLVERFATAAELAEKSGFDGVQIHGAHGYLVSQFLSPRSNHRDDKWGGSATNRRRFALEIYRAIRARTSKDFGVAIKINSADFQKGGISEDESAETVLALAAEGMDFVEISGGTYESPEMIHPKASTRDREAYFLDFAEQIRGRLETPLMVTGGWRSGPAMLAAIESGAIDLIGLARPLVVRPDFPAEVLADASERVDLDTKRIGISVVDKMGVTELVWYERQMHRMAQGKEPNPQASPLLSLLTYFWSHGLRGLRARRAK